MKSIQILTVILVAGALLAGCAPAPAPTQVLLPPPAVTVVSSSPQPAAPTASATAQYLPTCPQAAAVNCPAPSVDLLDRAYCVEKIPYVIMAAPAGTQYEWQNPSMKCQDQMHNDGRLRITCTGEQLYAYELKLCNGACQAAPSLSMDSPQCPPGSGLDTAAQCCALPVTASGQAGCTTFKVEVGACPPSK